MPFNINISEKDKRMVIILLVFLSAVGYYMFIVEPLYNLSIKSDSELAKQRKELLVFKTRLAGIANFEKKYKNISEMIEVSDNNIIMPYVDVPLDTKIKSIMYAAEKSSIKIRSIKPMNYIKELEGGKSEVINDKFFSIEGTTDTQNFLDFLRNLWGTKLNSVNISKLGNESEEATIRYYLKIEFLDKPSYKIEPVNKKDQPYKGFKLKNDPFNIIKPPPPPRSNNKPPPPPPKPKAIVHTLNGIELLGIADFNNAGMAILQDQQKNNEILYLVKGDSFRNSVVKNISPTEMTFYFPDNKQELTVQLKEESLNLTGSGSEDNAEPKNKRKGHLGIMVETFSQSLASRYKIEYVPGLFVISPGRHKDIFKKHDVITEINDQPVPNFEAALRVMNTIYAGQKLNIEINRDGKTQNVSYNAD